MMKRTLIVVSMVLVAGCVVAPEQGLERLLDARGMRNSSANPDWRNANFDAQPIAPGETIVLGEMDGPGIIRHIWLTISAYDPKYPRNTVLRIYWDGEEDPSVEAPLGDFFAVGHGESRTLNSMPVNISSNGRAYNCYWRMPFRKSAKVTMTNDSDKPVRKLYWYLDWTQERKIPNNSAYFHARYRQEYPCTPGSDYTILEAKGRGHYVGTVQSVINCERGWYGEGDDRFYIDGEEEPSLKGTGTEDYFCDAWGFREFNAPYYGVSIWEGMDAGDRGTVYRWHIPDPIPFSKSLKVTIEHKGSRDGEEYPGGHTGFDERLDFYSTVAYWYQMEPHMPFGEIPPVEQRMPQSVVFEGESMIDSGTFSPDRKSVQSRPGLSGGEQLFFTPYVKEASFQVEFEVAEDLEGVVELILLHSWDYGIYTITLDGEHTLADQNLYAEEVIPVRHPLPVKRLEKGTHSLLFECVGRDSRSKHKTAGEEAYFCGLDCVRVMMLKNTGIQSAEK